MGIGHLKGKMRVVVVCLLALATLQSGSAESIYRYVDDSGRVVFTNLGSNRAVPSTTDEGSLLQAVSGRRTALSREERFVPLIEDSSRRHGVSPDLVKAIVRVESDFEPRAISEKGCRGLMQLLPDTARRFGVADIDDPSQNIEGGVKYLRFLLDYFKNDLALALAGYNAGENAVTRYKGVPPYPETRDYVKKVTALYRPPAESAGVMADAAPKINRRIYRVIQSDGRVLFTNTPTEAVMD